MKELNNFIMKKGVFEKYDVRYDDSLIKVHLR